MFIQRGVAEGEHGLRHIMARCLNGDIIVLLEIDTRVLLGRVVRGPKKLTLNARVWRAGNVFAVSPLAVAGASSVGAATTTTRSGISICVAIEVAVVAATTTTATPATGLALSLWRLGRVVWSRSRNGPRNRSPPVGSGTGIVSVVTISNKLAELQSILCGKDGWKNRRSA